jgi:hypothetical protein
MLGPVFDIRLFQNELYELLGIGAGVDTKSSTASFKTLRLKSAGNNATFELAEALSIPTRLLEDSGAIRAFKKIERLVPEEIAALRERLRTEINRNWKITINSQTSYFGVSTAFDIALTGTIRLGLPWLDGDKAAMLITARARASIKLQVEAVTVNASVVLAIDVDVKGTVPVGRIEWDAPGWPAFDLPWPEIKLPQLQWMNIDGIVPNGLPGFSLPRLPFLDDLPITWEADHTPKLKIVVDPHGDLSFGTDPIGKGAVMRDGKSVASIQGFQVLAGHGAIKVAGTIVFNPNWRPKDRLIDDANLPFTIGLSGIDVYVSATAPPMGITFNISVGRIRIQAKNDPALFLVFQVGAPRTVGSTVAPTATELGLNIKITPASVSTIVANLSVVEPYPLDLIKAPANALGGRLMRIAITVDVPSGPPTNLSAFLKRVAEMLKAAAVWLGEKAGQAAQALASVAESAFELLKKILDSLLDAAKIVSSKVILEIRLDARTYRLRQILVTPKDFPTIAPGATESLGFRIEPALDFKPCLVVDLSDDSWVGIVLVNKLATKPAVTLGTDLWFSRSTSAAQPVKSIDGDSGGKSSSLIEVVTQLQQNTAVVLFAFRHGRIELFQKTSYDDSAAFDLIRVGDSGSLESLTEGDVGVTINTKALQDKLVNLLSKPQPSGGKGNFLESLESYIKITSDSKPDISLKDRTVKLPLTLTVTFKPEKGAFTATTKATLNLSLRDLSARLEGADRIGIKSAVDINQDLLGLHLNIQPKLVPKPSPFEAFYLNLEGGKEEFGLSSEAKATLALAGVSSSGRGLQFAVEDFRLGRNGMNLRAATVDDPVMLGGINMPFRFQSGLLEVVNSKFIGANLSGSGQLPPALLGEANVSINLRLKNSNGQVVVESANAKLDKGDDPIFCESTRFRFSLSSLEMSFEREGNNHDGNYHFYFLLSGKARFQPRDGEFASGLLKNLKDLEFVLDRAPLTGDGRLLMQRLSFQAKVDPPKKSRFFDLFEFELRGVGFHPSAPAFDGMPAVSISGQVKFTSFADKVQPHFRFHEMWIAPPKAGSALPQIRFDGLTVGLALGGMGEVEGTAVAVDGKLPTMYKPSVLPADVKANGFLAAGRLSIKGWASMAASMGFLELRKGSDEPNLAFFFYIQKNQLSNPIPTPVGEIYLREVGFGFGWRYTLAGIAEAEKAKTPRELIRILDEVSKYQGSLDKIEAWQPTYDSATLTLAMRAMFSLRSASSTSEYNAKKEKDLPNPLLFDVVAAIRSDLTFLMSVRAWMNVNYADWLEPTFVGRTRPTLQGYLYLSVPKKTFLGRFTSSSSGFIGQHPELPKPLRSALEQTKFTFSSTLYITPGLFHFELGWPFELSVEIGSRDSNFYLGCQGGLIFRIEDGAILYGYALRARGFAQIGYNTGGSFGAAVFARADFAIEGKLLSYLSARAPGETMFYGSFRMDVHVSVSVRVWLEFSAFGGTVHLETGYTLGVTLALAVEVALLLNQGLGVRAKASLGLQAFGRSLSLGIELQIGSGVLETARARVERFLTLGLGTSVPETDTMGRPPTVEPNRAVRAAEGDKRIVESAQSLPSRPDTSPTGVLNNAIPLALANGQEIRGADFWAMLFPTKRSAGGDWYVMQLIPRDLTGVMKGNGHAASFYAPLSHQLTLGAPIFAFQWDGTASDAVKLSRLTANHEVRDISKRYLSKKQQDGEPTVPLLWQECFLMWKDNNEKKHFKDPEDLYWSLNRKQLHVDTATAARELELAGRHRAGLSDTELRRNQAIEERRSAMIGIVANSALQLAQAGEPEPDKWWTPPVALLNCLDLGLTFLVDRKQVDEIFPRRNRNDESPKAALRDVFSIQRQKDDRSSYTDHGDICLFNPPERMFAESQPRLDRFEIDARPDGIAMNWDLEPAWGRSNSVFNDPEFHLRHYRIERYIHGLDEEFKCSFEVKAAAPVTATGSSFYEPPLQFLDDLTLPKGFPQGLRDAITGKFQNLEDWPEQYRTGQDIIVRYQIYAVDCAGTSDFGTPKQLKVKRPQSYQKGPRGASIRFEFTGTDVLESKNTPRVTVILDYDANHKHLPTKPIYTIGVLEGHPVPTGQYGADSLSTALEEINSRVIASETKKFTVALSGITGPLACQRRSKDDLTECAFLHFTTTAERDEFTKLVRTPGTTLRFFIRQAGSEQQPKSEPSPWRTCSVELRMGVEEHKLPVDAVLEEYERPVQLAFEPIDRQNFTETKAGRVYFLEPKEDTNLDNVSFESFETVLDRKRRAGIRLRWKARPDGLKIQPPIGALSDPWRVVGGFHLYDLTHGLGPAPISVALLPRSTQGLEPSEMGDLSLIESAYPSDATRRAWRSKAHCTGWFSLAESTPLFPDDRVSRRSLMLSVDEGLLASLFEKGMPWFLKVTAKDKDNHDYDPEMTVPGFKADSQWRWALETWTALEPRDVRYFLQGAILQNPVLDATAVTINALDKKGNKLVSKHFAYEACPSLHPVLADTLDLVRYSTHGNEKKQGDVYRRYEVVFDPAPSRTSDKFEGLIDATPEQRDPYGWSILRTLGLAAGFRLYDTHTGTFITSTKLVNIVGDAFRDALARYPLEEVGAPFVDLLTAPMDTARAFSFDGGSEATRADSREVLDKQVSVIQIALRPRVRALVDVPPKSLEEPIRYFIVIGGASHDKDKKESSGLTFRLIGDHTASFDVDLIGFRDGALAAPRASLSTKSDPAQTEVQFAWEPGDSDMTVLLRVVSRDGKEFPYEDTLNGLVLVSHGDRHYFKADRIQTLNEDPSLGSNLGRVLGAFPALDNLAWAMQFFGTELNVKLPQTKLESLRRLLGWVARAKLELPAEDASADLIASRSALAGKITNWWKRFLDHGLGKTSKWSNGVPWISLGTIGQPGIWRMAEAGDGTVGVFLTDDAQYGAIRRYVVRPYSRYEAFVQSLGGRQRDPPEATTKTVVDIMLPRTAPVAKPTILSAVRVPEEEKNPEVLELVVARTADETISSANQTTAMGLASDGISVGFWREFAEPKWARALLGDGCNLGAAVGSLQTAQPRALTLTDHAWAGVRDRVPDAWLGAWVYRMQAMPYFYRIHTLVHANAGVVVSEPSATTFVTGISQVPEAPTATYEVVANSNELRVVFDIPLITFRDCVIDAKYWDAGADYQQLAKLPDPGIAYRISLASQAGAHYVTAEGVKKMATEVLSVHPQFEVSASLGAANQHYVVQGVGERIQLADTSKGIHWLEAKLDGTHQWRLLVEGKLGAVREGRFQSETSWDSLRMKTVPPEDFAIWRLVAPLGKAVIDYHKPARKAEKRFKEYCRKQIDLLKRYFAGAEAPGLLLALRAILELPPDHKFEISDWVVGLPIPGCDGLSVQLGEVHWNPAATGTAKERETVYGVLTAATCDDSCGPIIDDLWNYLVKSHSAVMSRQVEREVAKEVFDSAKATESGPFDVIEVLSITGRRDSYTPDKLKALLTKLEESIAGGAILQALRPGKGSATGPAQIPWPASAEASRAQLEELFIVSQDEARSPRAYFVVTIRTPVGQDLQALADRPAFQRAATRLAEDAWFGTSRKPRLDALRGTAVPVSKEITRK